MREISTQSRRFHLQEPYIAFGAWGDIDNDGNAGKLDRTTAGFLIGADGIVLDGLRVGALAGWNQTSIDAFRSNVEVDSYNLGIYAARQWGALALRSGLAYTWHDIESERSVAFGGFSDRLEGGYDARTFQAFGEFGYRFGSSPLGFEPFANLAHVKLHTDTFTETGGIAALTVNGETVSTTFSTIGIRVSSTFDFNGIQATARGTVGWQHAFGDTGMFSTHTFSGGDAFTVTGVPIADNVAVIEAGLDFQISPVGTLGVSYTGQHGSGSSENGVSARVKLKF